MTLRDNLSALREHNFQRLFAAQVSSLIGDSMMIVATPFIVFHLGGDTGDVGLVLAATTLALIAMIFLGGVISDRTSPRRVMVAADLIRAAGQATLAVLLLTGHAQIWQVAIAQAINGGGSGFFMPAMNGLMPQSVSARRLQGGNALRGMALSGSQVVGPTAAGVLIAIGGVGSVVVADSASFLISALALSSMHLPGRILRTAEERTGMLAELREGWGEFRARRWMWVTVAGFAAFNALVYGPYIVLGASISDESLGGAGAWATILASAGAGAVIGGVLALRIEPRRPVLWAVSGLFGLLPVLLLLAATAPVAAIAPAAALGGASLGFFDPLWETSVQTQVPPEVLSRVSSYDWFGSLAFTPIGYALAGPYALLVGKSGALVISAVVLVGVTVGMISLGHLGEVDRAAAPSSAAQPAERARV